MTPKLSLHLARKLLLAVILTITVSSCRDDNDNSKPDRHTLTVSAYNAFQWSVDKPKGTLQPGANVSIYTSRADYYSKKPYKTGTADAEGKAVFTVAGGKYFVVAEWQETGKLISSIVPKEDASSAISKKGYVAVGLFQTDAEVNNSPLQAYARPGNFKWQDINGDGVVNREDLVELPSASVEVGTSNAEVDIIMGATENSLLTESVSKNNIYGLLSLCAALSYEANKQISTLDIMLSKEAKCTMDGFFGYCDLSNLYILPSNPYLLPATNVLYDIVKKANDVLYYTGYIEIPNAAEKAFLQAEARAFRGYAYLTLATYFGQADIITSRNVSDNPRTILKPQSEVYSQAKLDLEAAAATNIPTEFLHPAYITRHAAMALTARLALQTKDYSKAKSYSETILSTNAYTLGDNIIDAFVNLNSKELIWSYPQDESGPWPTQVAPSQGRYRPMVRLSEIYLIKAEARIHLGRYDDAKNILSIFAQRRNLPLGEMNTKANALQALYTITRAETYRDGRTFSNLVRWGIAKEVLENYKDHNNILPIPESLLQADPSNKQNPGY